MKVSENSSVHSDNNKSKPLKDAPTSFFGRSVCSLNWKHGIAGLLGVAGLVASAVFLSDSKNPINVPTAPTTPNDPFKCYPGQTFFKEQYPSNKQFIHNNIKQLQESVRRFHQPLFGIS